MTCLCATTRRAARLLTQRYEEALRPADLTPAQFELLATLAHYRGISQSALADVLALDQTTLSRNLKPLVTRALIARSPSPHDRRQSIYTLSAAGDRAFYQAMPLWESIHHKMQSELAGQWQSTLTTLAYLTAAATVPQRSSE